MKTQNDVLASTLNLFSGDSLPVIEGELMGKELTVPNDPRVPKKEDMEFENRLNEVETNLKDMIFQTKTITLEAMEIMIQGQSPRVLESIPNLVKAFTELNRDYVAVAEKKHNLKKMEEEVTPTNNAPNQINNTLFVGSTEDLMKLIGKK